jgi:hypothetical protein
VLPLPPLRSPARAVAAAATLVLLAGAGPARALSSFTLALDPAQSALTPAVGDAAPLSGRLHIEVGDLPLTGDTSFQIVLASGTATGGGSFSLDPTVPTAGLGVLFNDGSFLVPTLFLSIDLGNGAQDLAVPDVTGQLEFDATGTVVTGLTARFDVDSLGPAGVVGVTVTAVPEPSPGLLAATGATVLLASRRCRRTAR